MFMRGGGANRGGQWNGPTQTGGKLTPPPAFGARRQGPGTSSVAAARVAFKWQRKGLGIMSSRRPAVVAHNRYEQCKGMCIAVRSAWASQGLVVKFG